MNIDTYDLIVIGSGAAGCMAAIIAARNGKNVLLLEQLDTIGAKLKATGGGRCNLSNTLENTEFMNSFGRNGRFMTEAITSFDYKCLMTFLDEIGVKTHIPDGFRIFPITHSSSTIITALHNELEKQKVTVLCSTKVEKMLFCNESVSGVETNDGAFNASKIVVATGGLGYPILGANGDGYDFASSVGHKITDLHPAMLPLQTKETWVASCTADTIAKAQLRIDLPKAKKLKATGDLIFTKSGIRGPVVLDFAREITPFLEKHTEVPLLINMVKGMNEEDIFNHLKKSSLANKDINVVDSLTDILPQSVVMQICLLCGANPAMKFAKLEGNVRTNLVKMLTSTPLTITGHAGFKKAMITRGGVSLKEVNPKTMQSKIITGLYFCGEVLDLDGPCGGYNLQWSFSSGHLAGLLLV